MFTLQTIVKCESGLHNKQATYFIQKANEFRANVWVEVDERRGRKSRQSYQYVDVLTGTVELFDPESGEHLFTPLGNQLEEH